MTSKNMNKQEGFLDAAASEDKQDDAPDPQQRQQQQQASKRPKLDTTATTHQQQQQQQLPFRKIVTWNCNGFTTRCSNHDNVAQMQALVRQTDADLYCLQEVRLKAASPSNRGTPHPQDYQGAVERVLTSTVFADYRAVWSLADNKYAGTLTLIRKSLLGREQQNDVQVACSPTAARNGLMNRLGVTAHDCGMSIQQPEKQGSQSNNHNKTKKGDTKQRSVASFFAAKPAPAPASSSSSSKPQAQLPTRMHDSEGRFQFVQFPNFDVLQTYVPNNGSGDGAPAKWQRRADWDNEMQSFLRDRKRIYQTANETIPTLLWCGDLNVARDYRDGTHWRRVDDNNSNNNATSSDDSNSSSIIYEWWTDESQCMVQQRRNNNHNVPNAKHPDHVGMPGFTPAERRRFETILDEADLVDVWRALHPDGDDNNNNNNNKLLGSQWDAPNWTWRGALSKNNNGTTQKKAKYEGRGQRLDYFLLSPSSLVATTTNDEQHTSNSIVKSCTILGYGSRREGLFCGSDHCAVELTFK